MNIESTTKQDPDWFVNIGTVQKSADTFETLKNTG